LIWVFERTGIEPPNMLPRWARVCYLLLFPLRLRNYWAANVYDWSKDLYTIEGVKFSGEFFRVFGGPYPSGPFIVDKTENDIIIIRKFEKD